MAQPQYFCGLDLGTHTMKASIVCAKDEENLDLLGVFETRATGFKETSINDITELAECIQRTVQGVMQKTGIKIHAVQMGLSGSFLATRRSSAIIPLIDSGTKVISKFDLRKVDHQAKLLGVNLEEEIIHDFPQWYKIDDINTSINPTGLIGRKIESSLLLLTANSLRVRNLTKAVHQAGFEVNSVAFCGYAASIGLGRMHYLKKKQESIGIKTPLNFKDKVVSSVKELCQEYF